MLRVRLPKCISREELRSPPTQSQPTGVVTIQTPCGSWMLRKFCTLSPIRARKSYRQLQEFYGRVRLTAIGDSDYHGLGPMGLCRTFVFVRGDSEGAILDAFRAGHTVVYDRAGRTFGDPELISLAMQAPGSANFNPQYRTKAF